MDRRSFLAACAIVPPLLHAREPSRARERRADVVVVGGGVGGCAAALAVARAGRSVILTEETDWIGGQLTQQAVPPDEPGAVETAGITRSYRSFRNGVRDFYRRYYPLSDRARAAERLNPGGGLVSRLCCEPRVALAVLEAMLTPYVSSGRVEILLNCRAATADVDGDRIRGVRVTDVRDGQSCDLSAPYFLDATELGDLLPLAGAEFVTGRESHRETGEPHAPADADPADQQAITCCFAVEYLDGEDHTIDRPAEYQFWRNYVPALTPPWPGPLLGWRVTEPITLKERVISFDPLGPGSGLNLWRYRRIADRRNFQPGTYRGDITLVNWPQNDYWLGNLVGVPPATAAGHVARAKQLSLSLLYWLQTEAPRPDGKTGWKGLRLRPDLVGTKDGLAKYPYVRESRRIRAEFTVLEQHVGTEARQKLTGRKREELSCEAFPDTVGIGSYRIDLHPTSGGKNYLDIASLPFEIPLGSLLPRRLENLLAAAKNLGVTHITNGCYRLHPVEWNIGEAAGALAAFSLEVKKPPRRVRNDVRLLANFQKRLTADGVELHWPRG